MNTSRANELMASMKSFGKEAYYRSELLDELFALQREVVALTFNEDHATTSELRIWDVEKHLEQMNKDCGNVADEELARFKAGGKTLSNLIKSELSGYRGEAKAFRSFAYLRSNHKVLKNIELCDGDQKTELDAVVITPGGITIVEVKNTSRDIFIDDNGNYYRTGEFLKWDCNIAQKMDLKKELLRKVLDDNGFVGIDINRIVVFTDNRIQVQNKYSELKTCFVSQLSYSIDEFKGEHMLSEGDMKYVADVIGAAEVKQAYPAGFDAGQYKKDFAVLMAILEETSASERSEEVMDERHEGIADIVKAFLARKYATIVGSAAAGMAVSLLVAKVMDTIRK